MKKKNMVNLRKSCISVLMIFSSIFLLAVTFSHVLHPDVVRIETESENLNFLKYGYNAEQPKRSKRVND